jgi:NAD(P)-dependent dehydrogenase (short-subunit alcohol dehydrogenase family)
MNVLVIGGDTELGCTVADGFHRDGYRVILTGSDAEVLDRTARGLGAEAVVCETTDPASLAQAKAAVPYDLDAVVVVPAPAWIVGDPRTFTLAETAMAWRSTLDRTIVSVVLTVQAIADHVRSGGTIVAVVPAAAGAESAPDIAAKAALSAWTAAQANHFGARGITVNTVASGRPAQPGYHGLTSDTPSAAAEIASLATFLATPTARHITGQTLHVGRGAALAYR